MNIYELAFASYVYSRLEDLLKPSIELKAKHAIANLNSFIL